MARLQDFLAALDEDDSDEAILKLVLNTAAKRDPELPDLLRACAIPRVFTAEIVGVLRGKPDDTAGNERLLDLVCRQSFVIRRPDHGFIFHDSTRDQLLADWQAPGDEARTARYTKLNNALVDYYQARYTRSLELDAELAKVRDLIYQANPGRLRRLTAAIEATMAVSLQEATYHLLLTSPDRALSFFEDYFFSLEQASRVTIVRALISFIRDFIGLHQEASSPALLLWLDYYDARIKEMLPGYDPEPLIKTFTGLIDNADAPAKLRDWALGSLAVVYAYKGDFAATLATRFRLVEREVSIDPHNDPLRYYTLADLYWQQGDADRAVGYLRRCIARVTELDEARADFGIVARLSLATIHAELGDWGTAFASAVEALVLARTEFWEDVHGMMDVAYCFARLLAKLDPHASDCAATETIALGAAVPQDAPLRLLNYIDVLLAAGRTRTAETWLSRAEAGEFSPRAPLIRLDILERRGLLAWIEERREDCEALCSQFLTELPERPDTVLSRLGILMRRGAQRIDLGDIAGAAADYHLAREGYERQGYATQAAVAAARLASAAAKAGNIAEARTFLAAADAVIPKCATDPCGELAEASGDIAEAAADYPTAREHFEWFLGLAAGREDLINQAMILRKLATLQEKAGQPELATGYAQRAVRVWEQVAELDTPASADQGQAQTENGVGSRFFSQVEGRSSALELARQHFTLACALDPNNLWPALNLSFTCAAMEAWLEAATALARAMELAPEPLRTAPRLAECLRDYLLRYLTDRFARGDDWPAKAAAAARAVHQAAGLLPPADLAPVLAMQAVAVVLSGDPAAGQQACREALSWSVPGDRFNDVMAPMVEPLVTTVGDYWAVDDALRAVAEAADTPDDVRGKAAAAREVLRLQLDRLIGLTPAGDADEFLRTLPIVLEVGDGLVPDVDSRQDGGTFLYSLIPAMRDRIKAGTGVTVPGVRSRGNDALAARGYSIQVEEVPVMAGEVSAGAVAYRPTSATDWPAGALIDFHPRTGEPGIWALSELPDEWASDEPREADDDTDDRVTLSAPEYLINRIEVAARAHLARFLGPQEVAQLVEDWAEQSVEPGSPAARDVVPDDAAVLPLTWLLQRMVRDAVPISDWRGILAAVRDAGGLTTPGDELYRAVRRRLRPVLPGPRTGRTPVEVPADYELPPAGTSEGSTDTSWIARRVEFLGWLRRQIAAHSPAITLITETEAGRDAVAALARTQHHLVTALIREEAFGDD